MKLSTALNRENRGKAATVLVIVILLPVIVSLLGLAFQNRSQAQEVFLEKVDPKWQSCVREAEWMRFRHMDFLKQIREDVVRSGIKGGVTLAGCGDCHVNRANFCDKCHQVANVTLDCFGCHFYPETEAERMTALGPAAGR